MKQGLKKLIAASKLSAKDKREASKLYDKIQLHAKTIQKQCLALDKLKSQFILLTAPFKRGDKVVYTGLDRPHKVYTVLHLIPRFDSAYTVVCHGPTRDPGKEPQNHYVRFDPLHLAKIKDFNDARG